MNLARLIRAAAAILAVSAAVPLLPSTAQAITGGTVTPNAPYSNIAALYHQGEFMCGSSLVAPQWVLTAAHCILSNNPSDFTFVIGRDNLDDTDGEVIPAVLINRHESYGSPNPDSHDIALIKLARPATFGAPIRLADPATEKATWAPGKNATVVGYGGLVYPGIGIDGNLRKVDVPMVSDSACAQSYAATGDFEPMTMVCAGELYGTKDSCQGDSGGPLMVPDATGKLIQAGVVSWGFGCGYPTQYGVYGRVGDRPLYDWVQARIGATSPTGSVAGKVTDARTKAGLAGATVSCGAAGAAGTGTDGSYLLANVPVATYVCTASRTGYKSQSSAVTLPAGQTVTLNFALRK